MEIQVNRAISVGAVTKKILAINPELTTSDVIHLIKQSVVIQKTATQTDFGNFESIDEEKALRLAQATVVLKQSPTFRPHRP